MASAFDDPVAPFNLENTRRSIAMLGEGQAAPLDRDRALAIIAELQRVQASQRQLASELAAIVQRLERG